MLWGSGIATPLDREKVMEQQYRDFTVPQDFYFALSRWKSVLPILLLGGIVLALAMNLFFHDIFKSVALSVFACASRVFYPQEYRFDREGIWLEPRSLRRSRANRLLLAKRAEIMSWSLTHWKGKPAILLCLRHNRNVLLCYSSKAKDSSLEKGSFDWLNLACGSTARNGDSLSKAQSQTTV